MIRDILIHTSCSLINVSQSSKWVIAGYINVIKQQTINNPECVVYTYRDMTLTQGRRDIKTESRVKFVSQVVYMCTSSICYIVVMISGGSGKHKVILYGSTLPICNVVCKLSAVGDSKERPTCLLITCEFSAHASNGLVCRRPRTNMSL